MANHVNERYTAASGILDYCKLQGILVQAWAPVAQGRLTGVPGLTDERERAAAELVARIAKEKGTSADAIALAWLLKHPTPVQPIIGTTKPDRIISSCEADRVELTREEWYSLFVAARGSRMP